MLLGVVGVVRRGIPDGLDLVWTEEDARVTFRSSSMRGSPSDFVFREVARRATPENNN